MTKTKTPFLSFGAQGTIGDVLTAQRKGSETLLRQKPIPTDPRTLSQQYQRWLYQDDAYSWTQQSLATKREYAAAGVRYHLTGFQYWMKRQLPDISDFLAWWKLDEPSGAIARDSSNNDNPGTVFGALPIVGAIDGARWFDGVNDRIDFGVLPLWNIAAPVTLEILLIPDNVVGLHWFIGKANPAIGDGWCVRTTGTACQAQFRIGGVWCQPAVGVPSLAIGKTSMCHVTYDGAEIICYLDGNPSTPVAASGAIATNARPLYIGCHSGALTGLFTGTLDNFIIYNRILDSAELLRHSLRRYPP